MGGQGARVAGTMAANVVRRGERGDRLLEERHLRAAAELAETLGQMKGAAMKLGQLASFIELDFVPEEFREIYQDQLAALRDAAPPMEWKPIEKVLRAELPRDVFEDIDEEPAAAASVGQVHRATLRDGREVAVKVQYPGVAEAIRADLQNVGLLTRIAKAIAPGLDARAVAGEIRERVLEELDYEWEAQAQRRFERVYRGHPFIHVPAPVTDLCRPRVLVSEWVEGMPFAEVRELDDDERDRVAEIVYRFYYGSFHRVGAFNADPHPGNYLLLEDGRVSFLDYGSTRDLDPGRVRLMADYCLAVAEGHADRAKALLDELGYLARPAELEAGMLLESTRSMNGWFLRDEEVTVDAEVVRRTLVAANDPRAGYFYVMRRTRIPPEDVLIRRLDVGVIAVLGQLRASRNWFRIACEYWRGDPPSTELGRLDHEFFGEGPA